MFESYKYKRIADYLKLDKPLVIFDIETTGHSMSSDKIVRMAYIKVMPNGRFIKNDFLVNPEMRISPESTAVHGIRNKDVADKLSFRKMSKEIWDIFAGAYFGGFNIVGFDLPILRREFLRAGMRFEYSSDDIIDSKVIFNFLEPPTLSGAYHHYTGKRYADSNNAIADVEAVAEIMEKQFKKYKEVRDIKFINEIHAPRDDDYYIDHEHKFYWMGGEAYFNFSKYRDIALSEVVKIDKAFLEWVMEADFSKETKKIVQKALKGELAKKKK